MNTLNKFLFVSGSDWSYLMLFNFFQYLFFISIVENTEFLQQAALEEYGPELHVALRSRRDELHYLRKLTELLFPYILPPKATDCRYK